jgi:catechol 2,3-dioxygenase
MDRYIDPPFRITRTSHVVVTVADLDRSLRFYTELAGLKVTAVDDGTAFLRGVEEVCHHSLVLRQGGEGPTCDAIGFRVASDADLDGAAAFFAARGVQVAPVERRGQGRTLLVRHGTGLPFELASAMDVQPRVLTDYPSQKGGRALRLDHVQVIVPDVAGLGADFLDMGFRAAEVIEDPQEGVTRGMFLHRKNNPHDIVLAQGAGPRLHHFAFVTSDLQGMFRAADIAGSLGMGHEVERGPGRHGPGNGSFCYYRDPDGHRIELILPPMQYMDGEEPQHRWNAREKGGVVPWGEPASQRWREEATHFTGVPLLEGSIGRWVSG